MTKIRNRLHWNARDDGSCWAQIEIAGESGVMALTALPDGHVTATAVVEIQSSGPFHLVEDARTAAENWLNELAAGGCTSDSELVTLGASRRKLS